MQALSLLPRMILAALAPVLACAGAGAGALADAIRSAPPGTQAALEVPAPIARSAPATDDAPAPMRPIRVVSFNIRFDTRSDGQNAWPFRRHRVAAFLNETGADFIGLQEVLPSQRRDLGVDLPGLGWIHRTREASPAEGEATPILFDRSRWALVESRSGTFWLSDTPEVPGSRSWRSALPRIASWGVFRERESGRSVLVLNTHFDHASQEARERSARRIAEFIAAEAESMPVIVMGDFNAGPTNPARKILCEGVDGSPPLRDTYAVIHGGDERQAGTFHGFRGVSDGIRIDAILASEDFDVLRAAIVHTPPGGEHLSDHYPVLAELRLAVSHERRETRQGSPPSAPSPFDAQREFAPAGKATSTPASPSTTGPNPDPRSPPQSPSQDAPSVPGER